MAKKKKATKTAKNSEKSKMDSCWQAGEILDVNIRSRPRIKSIKKTIQPRIIKRF